MRTGADVLRWTGFDRTSVRASVRTQARIMAAHYYLALNLLRASRARYARLEAPPAAEETAVVEAPTAVVKVGEVVEAAPAAAEAAEATEAEIAAVPA